MSGEYYQDELVVITPRPGRSAYEYAVRGGYAGTEGEFSRRLAFLMNGAVVGYAEGSSILLSGDLAPGTYTLAYVVRKADGTAETVTVGTYTVGDETEVPDSATYTVTFVADGVTVGTVTYAAGDTSLNGVPDVPAKEGYTGVWETYDLSEGGNVTVHAVYTENAADGGCNNLADPASGDWREGYRVSISDGTAKECAGRTSTNFIPARMDQTLFVKGLDITKYLGGQEGKVVFYNSGKVVLGGMYGSVTVNTDSYGLSVQTNGDVQSVKLLYDNKNNTQKMPDSAAYIRLDGVLMDGYTKDDVIITVDEPIA